MDWDKLRIFKAVADVGSFTHAGERLNLSQSAISRQVSALENSLGVPLFHRHARGLVLTEQGEMLFETAGDVFDKLQSVEMQLTDSRVLPEGPLSITTVEFIASTWLAQHIRPFRSLYPEIELTLLLDDRVYDLNKREADIAIRLQKGNHSDLIERHIAKIDFAICASKSYLEKHNKPDNLNALQNHTLIAHPSNTYTPFLKPNWILGKANINPTNNPKLIYMNSMHTRLEAVKNGVGVSVLPRYIINHHDDLEIILPDTEIPSVDMYFVYPQQRRNSKKITVLKEYLLDHTANTFS